MSDLFSICYTIAAGYVAAGLVSSIHQLATSSPPSFQVIPDGVAGKLWTALLLIVAGPLILMRNAIRARMIEGRSMGWLMATTALATSWSFVSGVSVVTLVELI